MGRVEPAIVTLTSGLACRLRYHAGCRSSPPNEATSTTRSPSAIGTASIVERSLPDLCPVVTSSTTGIPKALPKIRPFETLKSARWMPVATLYNTSLDLIRIGPVPRSTVIGFSPFSSVFRTLSWYGTTERIACRSGVTKGGCLGFMGRFSVYHRQAYASCAPAPPIRRRATRRSGLHKPLGGAWKVVEDRERKDRPGYDEDAEQAGRWAASLHL